MTEMEVGFGDSTRIATTAFVDARVTPVISKKILYILSGIFIFILLIVFASWQIDHLRLNKIAQDHEKEIQAGFRKRELEIDEALRYSETRRKAAEHIRDSLAVRVGTLDRLDSVHRIELASIKGRYNKLNSSQLGQEMVKQANEK